MQNKLIRLSFIFFVIIIFLILIYLLVFRTFFIKNESNSVQEIFQITPSVIKAEACYQKITAKCPEGVECIKGTPEATFCNCIGGMSEIKEKGTENQYEICMINGEQYFGITLKDFEQGWYYGDSNQKKPGTPKNWTLSGNGTRSAKWHQP